MRKRDLLRRFESPVFVLPVLFVVFLSIYLRGAAPTVLYGDGGELQAVALAGGVAHPSGYPLFILAGQLFGRILGGDPAHRITVMSCFFGAAAVCALYMVLRKLRLSAGVSAAGAVIYGLSFIFWWSAIRAEVYTLAIFVFMAGLWLVLHAFEKPTLPRAAAASAVLGLSLTGHLAGAPAVLVLGAMLLFMKPYRARWHAAWPVMAGSFIAGLVPYLYLVWADSAHLPMNYLDYTIELGSRQFGLSESTFSNPFRRVFWLLAGDESRQTHIHDVRFMARTTMQLGVTLFVYQFSLLAIPLFAIGGWNLLRHRDRKTWMLAGMLLASAVFCVIVGNRRMVMIYAWPMAIATAIVLSFGLSSLLSTISGGGSQHRARTVVAGVLITITLVVSAHLIRYYWDGQEKIKTSMKIAMEQETPFEGILPDLSGYREPRILGEEIMRLIPENALVVFKWKYTILYYLHYIEGARPDISMDPYYPSHLIRLRRWAETHDLNRCPIVFVGRVGGLIDDFEGLVEVPVDGGVDLYIFRGPFESPPTDVTAGS
jgi:hypothetical protein